MPKLIFTLFLISVTTLVFAQTVNFGVKAGLNMSNSNGSMQDKNQYTPGFNAGGLLYIDYGCITIQPAVFFSTKGQKLPQVDNGEFSYVVPKTVYTLDYIEESLVVFYKAHAAAMLTIHLGGGPYVGQGISAKVASSPHDISAGFTDSYNVFYRFKNPDYGLKLIGGAVFKKKFLADIEYSQGFTNVANQASVVYKNTVFSLSVGYLFK